MDSSNPRNPANDAANAAESGETFVGTIRWIALAIGVACLALLTLVGGLAHATPIPDAPAPTHAHDAMRAHITAPGDRNPAQVAAMPANAGTSTARRGPQTRPAGARTARAVAGPHG
jgi:hypothetical protein